MEQFNFSWVSLVVLWAIIVGNVISMLSGIKSVRAMNRMRDTYHDMREKLIKDRGQFYSLDSLGLTFRFCRKCTAFSPALDGKCKGCDNQNIDKLFLKAGRSI